MEIGIVLSLLRCKHGICRNYVCIAFLVEDGNDGDALYIIRYCNITPRCGLHLVSRRHYIFSTYVSTLPKARHLRRRLFQVAAAATVPRGSAFISGTS
jgi:hypothetical protein